MERNRYSLPTDSRDPWVSNGFFLLDVSTLWWREEYTAYGAGARIRIRLHIRVRCRGSPLDENTSSSMKTPHHRGTRMKDPEELQRPRRPCTRGLRAWLWFGVGGVKLKTKQVRKSPMNETFSLFAGGAIFIWVMALMGWNCFDGLGI